MSLILFSRDFSCSSCAFLIFIHGIWWIISLSAWKFEGIYIFFLSCFFFFFFILSFFFWVLGFSICLEDFPWFSRRCCNSSIFCFFLPVLLGLLWSLWDCFLSHRKYLIFPEEVESPLLLSRFSLRGLASTLWWVEASDGAPGLCVPVAAFL